MLLKVKNPRNGFTLVELSIVLVIIGLLIGGILAAQSMIGTAKIQAFVRQLGQFDAAVENFKTKYDSLPGDSRVFGGNGDGRLLDGAGGFNHYSGEVGAFWYQLGVSGLTNPDGAPYADATAGQDVSAGVNIPRSKLGIQGTVFVPTNIGTNNEYDVEVFSNGGASILASASAFKTVEGLAVSTKIGDGNAANPIIQAVDLNVGSCVIGGTPAKWNLANTSVVCGFTIRIGGATGDLQ